MFKTVNLSMPVGTTRSLRKDEKHTRVDASRNRYFRVFSALLRKNLSSKYGQNWPETKPEYPF